MLTTLLISLIKQIVIGIFAGWLLTKRVSHIITWRKNNGNPEMAPSVAENFVLVVAAFFFVASLFTGVWDFANLIRLIF